MGKSTSMRNKLQNNLLDNMNIHSTLETSVNLPHLDYNIVDDMKKTRANISLFELAKIQSQRDILLRALGQTSIDNVTTTRKGASTPSRSLSTMLNTFWIEEATQVVPHSCYIFNFSTTIFTTVWLILAQ